MAQATEISAARLALKAESIRRCNHAPNESYILSCLSEKNDLVAMFSAYTGLVEAAQKLQRDGYVSEIKRHRSRINDREFITVTAHF